MSKKVLVVDDSAMERIYLRKILEGYGCIVVEAQNGRIAIEMAKSELPGLILMDVVMQETEVSGFAATRKISNFPATANIPIVMVTTKNREPDRDNAKESGAMAYIVKPATPQSIKAMLDKVFA